jgi:hypothetical protein
LAEEVPRGSVALALFLTAFGAAAFVLAWLHWTQAIFGKEQAVSGRAQLPAAAVCVASATGSRVQFVLAPASCWQEIGFTIVGVMTFLPGAYHSHIAYHCWRGTPGYRWTDIPSY